MFVRLAIVHVDDGKYDLVFQIGHFAAAAVRILKRQTLDRIEEILFEMEESRKVVVNGREYPINPADVSVITSDIAITNLDFGR